MAPPTLQILNNIHPNDAQISSFIDTNRHLVDSQKIFENLTGNFYNTWYLGHKTFFFITDCETCGLYYKYFTIVIYDRNDSDQYYKTRITIVLTTLVLASIDCTLS